MLSQSHLKMTRIAALVVGCTLSCVYAKAANAQSSLQIADVDCFLNWAEVQLPTLLRPALQPTQTLYPISYRAYTGGVFAGVDNSTNSVLAVGGGFGSTVRNFGPLASFLPTARAASCGTPGNTNQTSTSATADLLVGSWTLACAPREEGPGTSTRYKFQFTKTNNTTLGIIDIVDDFANESCSGSPSNSIVGQGTVSLGDAVTASGQTATKVVITFPNKNIQKLQIFSVNNNQLYIGDSQGAKDSAGYPTTLEAGPYVR